VPGSQAFFIDATPQEELACADRLHLFFNGSGKVCGMRSEGTEGVDLARFKPLLEVSSLLYHDSAELTSRRASA
jgi:exosome complex component RRP42